MTPGLIYVFVREKGSAVSAGPKNAVAGYLHAGLGALELYEWCHPELDEYVAALREYLHAAARERLQRGDPVYEQALVVARHRAYIAREAVHTPQ